MSNRISIYEINTTISSIFSEKLKEHRLDDLGKYFQFDIQIAFNAYFEKHRIELVVNDVGPLPPFLFACRHSLVLTFKNKNTCDTASIVFVFSFHNLPLDCRNPLDSLKFEN